MATNEKSRAKKVPHTLRVVRIAVFAALSVVGSFIHLPSPVPSVAFDSAPGFFAALYFGPVEGFCVFGFGHLATAVVSDFPLGILHLPIALGLAFAGAVVGVVNQRWNVIPAVVSGIAINTGLVVLAIPVLGVAGTLSFTPFLFVAAVVNGVVATVAYLTLRRRL
jgi:uncharacterized membrane protein